MSAVTELKCRKCRTVLTKVSSEQLLNAHCDPFSHEAAQDSHCPSITGRTEIYLPEEGLCEWISAEVERSEWTRGKLKCPKCTANVGSFDFFTGQKCECREFNQPPVHLIMSKIDMGIIKGT